MKKETKKVAKRMKEEPKSHKGIIRINKKGTKAKKKLTKKQILKRIIGTPIIAIAYLIDFIYEHILVNTYKFIKKHYIIAMILIFVTVIVCTTILNNKRVNNVKADFEESIEINNKEKDELKSQLELLQTQLNELKEQTDSQQEETNNRLEELDKKVTSRNAVERQVASTTTTQPADELQEYAHNLVINEYGWTEEDFTCLVKLWNRESNWNPNAHNSSSGAHGIPQSLPASKMASEGDDYYTNGETQIRWGLKYIANRYGDPTNAWAHSQSTGWY